MHDRDELVRGYLAAFGADFDADEKQWAAEAWEEVDEMARLDPDAAWDLLLPMVEAAPSGDHLDWIAGGPLESLILHHGDRFFARINKAFDDDLKFRMCMAHVIIPEADTFILDLIERALNESYPLSNHQSTKET